MLTDGGQAQLWLASNGVAAAVAWTVLVTEQYGDELVEGVLAALALAAVTHATLGNWAAAWRDDAWGWALQAVPLVLVLVTVLLAPGGPAPARLAPALMQAPSIAG